jgi:hypothetical protein
VGVVNAQRLEGGQLNDVLYTKGSVRVTTEGCSATDDVAIVGSDDLRQG